jgi:transposase InsO family protein
MVVSDNGTELTSHGVLAWCQDTGVEWHYIAPGKALLSLSKGLSRTALWNRLMVACATSA